ncbi:hypothetical protein RJ55_00325 [Drechmeria coniospora]|nr:hypothetical protein RJ55_00325 [Drechmeria coniospora]
MATSVTASTSATRVLAVASHVVSGNVGNKIAVFVLQSLGYDVAALNTVQFSNHTGYGRWTGTKASADEIADLFRGLQQCYLDDFDMMLSGYVPGAEAVAAVGDIAKELIKKAEPRPGSFFWVLDPVMGDNGKIYVAEDVVPAYKSLVPLADLILPNQFEAEFVPSPPSALPTLPATADADLGSSALPRLLSGVKIDDMKSLEQAISALHDDYRVPHVVITSVNLSASNHPTKQLSVVGSSRTSTGRSRLFQITFPAIDCYFCGTGDMFGALMAMRMREAVEAVPGLRQQPHWLSGDDVPVLELPLAKAAAKVLASMHQILTLTKDAMPAIIERTKATLSDQDKADNGKAHAIMSKAAELQLTQNLDCLRAPTVEFKATAIVHDKRRHEMDAV